MDGINGKNYSNNILALCGTTYTLIAQLYYFIEVSYGHFLKSGELC